MKLDTIHYLYDLRDYHSNKQADEELQLGNNELIHIHPEIQTRVDEHQNEIAKINKCIHWVQKQ